jgi:hypothetical protein
MLLHFEELHFERTSAVKRIVTNPQPGKDSTPDDQDPVATTATTVAATVEVVATTAALPTLPTEQLRLLAEARQHIAVHGHVIGPDGVHFNGRWLLWLEQGLHQEQALRLHQPPPETAVDIEWPLLIFSPSEAPMSTIWDDDVLDGSTHIIHRCLDLIPFESPTGGPLPFLDGFESLEECGEHMLLTQGLEDSGDKRVWQ